MGHLAAHVRPEVRRRLDWHRGRGDRVVVVSASPDAYVRVAAERLAADGAIATRLEVDDSGRLTGRYDGGNCRGEEKIRRLRLWMADAGLEDARLWAYGNSRGDLRMLRAADTGVNVGRLGRLGRLAGLRGSPTRPVRAASTAERPDRTTPAWPRTRPRGTPASASRPGRTSPRWAAGRR